MKGKDYKKDLYVVVSGIIVICLFILVRGGVI